jgi:transposase InsO family protein
VTAKYAFIDAEKATTNADGSARYTVKQMCTWLAVSTSGFYDWATRAASATARRRQVLAAMIVHIFTEHDGTYGYRRVHAVLARRGYACHPETVRDLMRELGLVACQPRTSRRGTTRQAAKHADIPDLVERDFTSDTPGAKLVGDITYVRTWEGWLYVALVIDCASRAIVGWAMDDNYKTPLIEAAIRMAARNLLLPAGAIFHSDRGSNYTSDDYAKALKDLGIRQSVGRTGICFDNALAESTNGALKVELVNREQFPTREIARRKIARYIELFYNRRRLHSGLAYQTPQEILDSYNESPTAA